MGWFRHGAKAPDSLDSLDSSGPDGGRRIDPEELAAAREIVRRALDAESADGESAGRDLFRLGTA
ncbi:hypothetical protein KGQ20_18105 [Catenulispora sp. NF23]|uniref:Uncharacterized protein n=1 Tax=Catenulispora pinistramenti TaxID=2705254 RepID=A0ABS5KYT1_9ACTN|nr:hypothetical protein [Catenulispora pinistramenti]MBS2534688.1 hypothetical protein [Catenulispora pinistramenti]MBS2551199.1 hypothetical protein [Catenulispora pinistramenti]